MAITATEQFRQEINLWVGSYTRVMASYMAVRTPDGRTLLLCGNIAFGTEIDIPDFHDISVRDPQILAGSFRVDPKRSITDLLNESFEGRLEVPDLSLSVANPNGRGIGAGFNSNNIDSTRGSQLGKQLWLTGATTQELFQLGYDPNRLTERLQTLDKPFKNFQALAKHVNIAKDLVDRGSCLVVTARSPLRVENESRLTGEQVTVKFSLGRLENPSTIRLGYVIARGDEEIPGNIDLMGKIKPRDDRSWEGNVTFSVGKADNVKIYFSRAHSKIGDIDLFPVRAAEQVSDKPKKRSKGRVFPSIFETYTGIGSTREGGTGYVLKVKDEDGKIWALKYLKPEKLNAERGKRFRHEMAFCFGFRHESIIRVVDFAGVEIDKKIVPFYIMPYYEKSLRNLISAGMNRDEIIPLYLELIDGLAQVHEREIIHRDIKPENILYDETVNKLIMADFGIAHFAEEDIYTTVETEFAARLANYRYAAPEQREKGKKVEQQADIWAMGLILNEMFTQTLNTGDEAPTIAQVAPNLAYLDDVVKSMTKHDPLKRPRSFTEVRRLIREGSSS